MAADSISAITREMISLFNVFNRKSFLNPWQLFWGLIWEISETTRIGLGRFAPFVFVQAMGHKGKEIQE